MNVSINFQADGKAFTGKAYQGEVFQMENVLEQVEKAFCQHATDSTLDRENADWQETLTDADGNPIGIVSVGNNSEG